MAVSTRVIGGALKATGITALDVATQDGCATALHGLDDFEMRNRQPMVAAIRLAVGAKRYRPVQRRLLLLPAADRRPTRLRLSITGACPEDSQQSPRSVASASSSAGWTEARCGPLKTGSSASPHRPPEDGWRKRPEGCEYHGPS